jgi:hypothetical protein
MKSLLASTSTTAMLMNIQRNLSFKPRESIATMSLTLILLLSMFVLTGKSDIYALSTRSGHPGAGGLSGIPANAGTFNRGPIQPQASGTAPLTGIRPSTTSCAGPNVIFPGANSANCAAPNVISPSRTSNTPAAVQSANCNVPTTVRHTNTPSTTVVHPTNCPNATVIQPTNCNVPTTVRHTNTPSTTVVHPTNCPPTSSTSNSLTINNVQSSGATEQSTSAGLFDYLVSQNNIPPVANAGTNQLAYSYSYVTLDGSNSYDPNGNSLNFSWMQVGGDPISLSNYNAVNPIFVSPIVPYPTTLTFQLIVNNGQSDSDPSYVYITVEP